MAELECFLAALPLTACYGGVAGGYFRYLDCYFYRIVLFVLSEWNDRSPDVTVDTRSKRICGGASYSPSDSVVGTVFVFASRNIMRSALLTVVYETSEISGLGPLLH